ncbi:MAG: hypothetical protein OHK0031_15990 [Anaerolineales bacterium]
MVETLAMQVRLHPRAWSPPSDLYETEDAYVVRVEVAGMRQQDFSVSLQNGLLAIRGVRPDTPERRAYHQMEIRFGEFSLAVALPGPVNAEAVIAEYHDGFLTILLPKA